MKTLFIIFSLIGCFNAEQPSSSSDKPADSHKSVSSNHDVAPTQQKTVPEEKHVQNPIEEVVVPEILGLRLVRIPHFLLPEVYLHAFITETKNNTDHVEYEICHQSIDCFQFESTQVYDLIEDHYPDGGIPDGVFSIKAKPCYQNICGDSIQVEGHFKNQIDPIAQKKLNDRRLIIADLKNDLNILRNIFQDYLDDSKTCELLNQSEGEVIKSLRPLIELQLSIHHENYLDLLTNNYPDKNDSFSREKIKDTVTSMLDQESILNQIILDSKVENQNQIGLFCQEGDVSQEVEEGEGENNDEEESGANQSQESASGFLKSIAGVLGQQFNPVEGFKRNFLNSISDLKDPLRNCSLACPALISLRTRLGQAVPVFTHHLKSLLEIDESLYGTSPSSETTDDQ